LGVGSILTGEFLFKKSKAILTIFKTSIPLILVFMFLKAERELQHRASDWVGGYATLQLNNYVAKEKVDILVWEPCSLFGATLFTLPLNNTKFNISMTEDSTSFHFTESSWVYKLFGGNYHNETVNRNDLKYYDVYLTSKWHLPPENSSNKSIDTWTLVETVSLDSVPTHNYLSKIHGPIERRNNTEPVLIYVKTKSLHKISKK